MDEFVKKKGERQKKTVQNGVLTEYTQKRAWFY